MSALHDTTDRIDDLALELLPLYSTCGHCARPTSQLAFLFPILASLLPNITNNHNIAIKYNAKPRITTLTILVGDWLDFKVLQSPIFI
jgi:hypothetical protein